MFTSLKHNETTDGNCYSYATDLRNDGFPVISNSRINSNGEQYLEYPKCGSIQICKRFDYKDYEFTTTTATFRKGYEFCVSLLLNKISFKKYRE
jgi:hypothetical protein